VAAEISEKETTNNTNMTFSVGSYLRKYTPIVKELFNRTKIHGCCTLSVFFSFGMVASNETLKLSM
jgi:hypothetical protein